MATNEMETLDELFDEEYEEDYNDCPCGFGHGCNECCYETDEGYCDYVDSMPDR